MSEWISIEERLPSENQRVLIAQNEGPVDITYFWRGEFGPYFKHPTHWMPLPDAPEFLRPCPFCGNTFIQETQIYIASGLYYASECMSCEARGPSAKTPEEARAKWNQIG